MTFRPDPAEWENKKMTEASAGGDFNLKTLGNFDLINMYRDYDVFYAHWIATNRLGKLEDALTLKKQEDWHEDYWDCIWFRRNKEYYKEFFEPVYIGTPLDTKFPEDDAEFFIQIPMLFDTDFKEDKK